MNGPHDPEPSIAAGTGAGETAAASSLEALEWPRLLDALRARLATAPGAEAFGALAPLPDVEAVRRSLTLIQELKLLLQSGAALDFGGIEAVGPLIERAEKEGALSLDELGAVSATQAAALRLHDTLTSVTELPGLRALAQALHPEQALCATLARAFAPDGTLSERAYPNLARLRADIARQRAAVHRLLEHLIRSKAFEHALQEPLYTLRGHRYVLPIKTDFRGQVPGIVHDVSASGATLFIEPHAVVEETNGLALLEKQLDLETERILRELSHQVGYAAPSLRHNLGWLGRLDLLHVQARLSAALSGTAPEVWSEGVLDLKGLAHPLLLLAESGRAGTAADNGERAAGPAAAGPVVRNDLALGGTAPGAGRCMVISGANSGGKTVLLKAVGLSALLLAHGMHIPALGGSRLDWFPHVWAEAGDPQDLGSALSTFSARIRFVADVLRVAGPGHLVLVDELLSGTEPQEGAALAGQVVRALVARGAISLVTTHYGDLKLLASQVPGIVNGSVSFDPERLVPTYRLQIGLPGASYAFPIALRYGLEPALVEGAQAGLAGRAVALDSLLHDVQALNMRLEGERAELEALRAASGRRERELERRGQELDARRERLRRQEQGEVSQELREARAKIAAVIRELQSAHSLPLASKVREQLAAVETELASVAPAAESGAAMQQEGTAAGPLAPGSAVFVRSIGRTGTLVELIDAGRGARVQLGAVTAEVASQDLAPAAAAPAHTAPSRPAAGGRAAARRAAGSQPAGSYPASRHVAGSPAGGMPAGATVPLAGADAVSGAEGVLAQPAIPSVFSTSENTVDLRGLRLDEALERAERFFDTCVMKHVSPVVLIHGHGTGKLKAGLRDRLRFSRYVAALRPGDAGEGRDGVTVVALNV